MKYIKKYLQNILLKVEIKYYHRLMPDEMLVFNTLTTITFSFFTSQWKCYLHIWINISLAGWKTTF